MGQAIVASLAGAGYPVRGLVRDASKVALVRAMGGAPVVGDVLDREAVRRAVTGCHAVIQVAATYPDPGSPPELPRRVRVEGTRNLAEAAKSAGARRLLVGSGYWVYADCPGVLTEDSPLDPQGESRINLEAERAGLEAGVPGDFDVVVVRPGMVYGDGSWFRGMVESIRDGSYQYPGEGRNRWSLVERHDAAGAFRLLLERGAAGQSYLVVDDAPISVRELADLVARELGAPIPRGIPMETLRHAVGDVIAHHLSANRSGSNQKLRGLEWVPRHPDARQGIPVALRSMAPS